jgi:hypothetical protein
MPLEKSEWIARYSSCYRRLSPSAPAGQLPEIAETYWFYLRHRVPEDVALDKVNGVLERKSRAESWISACSEAIRDLDHGMDENDTRELATQLWDADLVRAVDPYVMANALWDQAILLSRSDSKLIDHPLSDLLRTPPRNT